MIINMKEFNFNNQEDLKEFEKNLPKYFKPSKNRINRFIEKIDNAQFYIVKKIVLYFVKRSKYQNNKFKVMLFFKKISLSVFVVTIFMLTPIGLYALSINKALSNFVGYMSVIFIVYSFLLLLDFWSYAKTQKKELLYEPLFLLRKHPHVYKSIKLMTDTEFIISKTLRFNMIKMRLIFLTLFYICFPILIFSNGFGLEDSYFIYFIVLHLVETIDLYINSVFDFDKPKSKKRKVTVPLTELAKKLFEDMSKIITPIPNPINLYEHTKSH